ncbi:hypothetical protein SAMN05428989_0214 [Pseudoxanthomonas sp. GM95]|nr:hypothetical protein SAMN05428989_0214 [Pseudoxanthomonas sp. GM95]
MWELLQQRWGFIGKAPSLLEQLPQQQFPTFAQ